MNRAVLIPGLMGTALRDATRPLSEIKTLCGHHWQLYPRLKEWLEERGNEVCNADSDAVWGRLQFLHWLADVKGWLALLTSGDGYSTPGGLQPKCLTELSMKLSKQGKPQEFKPYGAMVSRLQKEGVDLLVFPYDWRLRAHDAVARLGGAIRAEWWPDGLPNRPLYDSEKVVLIGHSLGGIIARLFVEDPSHAGHRFVRRNILIGTPNKGAPVAFAYFTGTKTFFDDYPFWAVLRWLHDQQPRNTKPSPPPTTSSGAGGGSAQPTADPDYAAWSSRELEPSMILESEQKDLVQSLASICQLVPTYDFVQLTKKKKEKLEETYKYEVHKPTQKKLKEILEEVSSQLKDAVGLDAWLGQHGIYYDLLGSTTRSTVVGLQPHRSKRGKFQLIEKKSGDGTVPAYSAIDWARSEKGLKNIEFMAADYRYGSTAHAELCRHKQVIEHCVARTKKLPKSLITGTALEGRMNRGDLDQYMKIAYDVFLAGRPPIKKLQPNRTQVICLTLIEGFGSAPLINPETVVENDLRRLKEAVPGIDSTRVVYSGKTGDIAYEFVLLGPKSDTPAGVLFLPTRSESWLHLFGIITKPWEKGPCRDNSGHAEMQLKSFLDAQSTAWRRKIMRLHLWNENLSLASRRGYVAGSDRVDNRGFSPCAPCCADLAGLQWAPTSDPKNNPQKIMNWKTAYPGRKGCDNQTTRYSLELMEKVGWQFVNSPMPSSQPP